MARDRKFVAYRRLERPYTRKSKYRRYQYVRGTPHSKIVRFVMGSRTKTFPLSVKLVSKTDLQIRHSSLEASRMSANRRLEKAAGKQGYYFRIHKYPHHILRENPLASGAGADRLSTGMKKSFGKAVGVAAQVRRGDVVIEIGCEPKHLDVAKKALNIVCSKLPNSYYIVVDKVPTGSNEVSKTHKRLPKVYE